MDLTAGLLRRIFNTLSNCADTWIHFYSNTTFDYEALNNGTNTQLTNTLVEGEANVALGRLLAQNGMRYKLVDFEPVLFLDHYYLLVKKPKLPQIFRYLFSIFAKDVKSRPSERM